MGKPSRKINSILIKIIFIGIAVVFLFNFAVALAAQELTTQQKEARAYRVKGIEYQNAGDLVAASAFYQKAITLDPFYAVAYNDLGIIYEAGGERGRAKDLYLKALEVDPNLLAAYANLAIICEEERDLKKAVYYWQKRAELGNPDEPWTIKAKNRLADIELVLSDNPVRETREKQVITIGQEAESEKAFLAQGSKKQGDKALAKQYLKKAKRLYKQGKEVDALKIAFDAQQMDPSNKEIEDFLNKLSTRLLSR